MTELTKPDFVKAVEGSSRSIARLLDDVSISEDDILNCELDLNQMQKDIEHLQDQIKIIEMMIPQVEVHKAIDDRSLYEIYEAYDHKHLEVSDE